MMFLALLLLLWTQVVCATHGDPMALSITPAVIFASRLDTFCQIELLTIPITPTLQRCYTQAIERNSQISPQEADNIGNCVLFTDGLSPFLHAVFDKFGDRFFATFVSLTTLSPAIAMAWSIDDLDKRLFLVRKVDCARTAPTRYVILLQYEKGFVHAEAMATPLREETNLSLFRLFCQDCGEVYQQSMGLEAHDQGLRELVHDILDHPKLHQIRDNTVTIAIAGSASATSVDRMRQVVEEEIEHISADRTSQIVAAPTFELLNTPIDASQFVAYSAAIAAYLIKICPHGPHYSALSDVIKIERPVQPADDLDEGLSVKLDKIHGMLYPFARMWP